MRLIHYTAVALLTVFFGLFLVMPLYTVIAQGIQPAYLLEVVRNPIYVQGLGWSFAIGITVTLMVFIMALPLAFLADRYEFRGKMLVNTLVLLPLILPPFVGALGFVQIFGKLGALNSLLAHLGCFAPGQGPDWLGGDGRFWIVCLIEALHLYPILYLNLSTSLANLDPSLNEAAENLGCKGFQRFWRITLPLIRPGIFAGGIIVFIWAFTELGTPLMLGFNRVTAVQIFNGVTELGSNPLPYTLVFVLLVISGGLYLLSHWLFGRQHYSLMSKGMAGSQAKTLRGWRGGLALGAFVLVGLAAALPHLGVALLSVARDWHQTVLPSGFTLRYYSEALGHPLVVPSILNSLNYSLLAMVICVIMGLLVAILTVRWRPVGHQAFDVLAMLPLAIPGIIMAFGYLSMATRYDWLRTWLDPIKNPTLLLILAFAMRRLPYVVRAAVAGLQQTPIVLEEAAANLGASQWRTLRKITIPLIAANLVAGALFAFSFSMLEVSDSLILAQKAEFYPITRALYELAQILGSGPYMACAFGVWAMAFLAATLLVANRLLGRTMGALFRV
jgi:iron(III) transport system permease protein